MIETDFLRHLKRLQLLIDKRVTSNYAGERESVYSGRGLIFRDRRIYAPGDDYRDIDWRVFARTDKLHVKKYEEERALTVHIIIDYSASMNFGTDVKKYEYAAMLGIGFAFMSLKRNEKFVLSTFSDRLDFFRPKRGLKQLVSTVEYLKEKKAEGVSRFEESLKDYAKKAVKNKSMIVIISDFLYNVDEIKRSLFGFKNQDVILIQILDLMEKKLGFEGEFNLKDLETKGILRTFISPFLRKNYLSKLDDHVLKIKQLAYKVGAKFESVTTNEPIYDVFYRILTK